MSIRQYINKYALVISAVVCFGWILMFLPYEGTIRVPAIVAWVPSLLGWNFFIILSGIGVGWVCHLFCKNE
jgi:hypothetical protein|tara:strand:+ start:527 stop:739 length:213 start_codon:yes stop_codon:yes gene_type:complete